MPDAVRLVAAVLAGGLFLPACGGGSAAPAGGPSTGVEQVFDPNVEAPAAPIQGARRGGTVTVLTWSVPDSLDPTHAYYADTTTILSGLVTRSLTQYVWSPDSRSMVLIPDIATDLGTSNTNFTEWTFTIRDGVRFEDGTEVTAEDVAFGIKRSLDRDAFRGGATYSNDYFLNGDSYKGPYRSGIDYPGVVVNGDKLTVKMSRPFPEMPYYAAMPAMGPIPATQSDPDTYGQHPLATGPYKFASDFRGESLTLVRNDEWDPATDPGRHAYPDRYVFEFAVPERRRDAAILADSPGAQTTLSYDNVLPTSYARARRLETLTLGSTNCIFYWALDYRKITELKVRQAIGLAYPYKDVAPLGGFIYGVTFLPGTSMLPPGLPGHREYNVLGAPAGQTQPGKAKTLLREAGYAPGEYELRIPYDVSDPDQRKLMNLLVESYSEAGFTLSPYPVGNWRRLDGVKADPNAPIDIRPSGWCPDWPSGSGIFPQVLHSQGENNHSFFDEPAVDAEIERIGALPIEEQVAQWGALDERIMTDHYPILVGWYAGVAMPHGSRVGGMIADDFFGMPTWKDLHILQ